MSLIQATFVLLAHGQGLVPLVLAALIALLVVAWGIVFHVTGHRRLGRCLVGCGILTVIVAVLTAVFFPQFLMRF